MIGEVGNVTIRRLRREDADGVRALNEQILGKDRSATWNEYVEKFLAASRLTSMSLPWSGSQVAEVDGEIAGFVLSERQSTGYGLPVGARIVAIAVHPKHRRTGIGRRLVDALKADCRANHIGVIYSVLQADDERDLQFLASCGFKPAPVKVMTCEL